VGGTSELILISAMTRERVIGREKALPWHIPDEYASFLGRVRGHPIVMGRTSYEIFGADLKGKSPIVVVSRSLASDALPGADVCPDTAQAVSLAETYGERVFSAGGGSIYRQTLPLADALYLSFIKKDYAGDTYFPEFDEREWTVESTEDHPEYEFRIYSRRRRA
jgi:dihydrofolate reductase